MDQLDLLWKLQQHEDCLKIVKRKLESLEKDSKLNAMIVKNEDLKNQLKDRKELLEKHNEVLRKNDSGLKDLNYRLDEIDKELYGGTVTDLQQLDYMNKESKVIKDSIDKLELKMISLMEDMEEVDLKIEKIELEYENNNETFKEFVVGHEKSTQSLKNEAEEEAIYIKDVSSKVEEELYEKYKNIKSNKGYALAKVTKDECSGCHVIVPTYLLDKVKNKVEITQCENCGRILYFSTHP